MEPLRCSLWQSHGFSHYRKQLICLQGSSLPPAFRRVDVKEKVCRPLQTTKKNWLQNSLCHLPKKNTDDKELPYMNKHLSSSGSYVSLTACFSFTEYVSLACPPMHYWILYLNKTKSLCRLWVRGWWQRWSKLTVKTKSPNSKRCKLCCLLFFGRR